MSIPDHWKILPFIDCLRKVKTKKKPSIPKKVYRSSGKFPVIDQGASFIAGWTDSTESIISDNLPIVIFGDHTRIFKYVDFPFALGADGTKLLYPNEGVLYPRFFYYALLNLKVPNKGYNRHYRYLRDFSIVAPPLPEQRAIAHILQTIQQAKITRQREITLERERKAALIDYLFSHGTKNEPRKETQIAEIPESWEVVRLGEVTDIFKGGTPRRSVEKYFQGDIPWATPTDITALGTSLYIDETRTYISDEALNKSAARLLPIGTVLLTSRATIGKTAISTVPMSTNQGFSNFICRDTLLNVYLAYYLRYIKQRLIDLASGSIFKEITKGTLLNVKIPLPPLPEQHAITDVFRAIDKKIEVLEQETQYLDELFHAMLDELMTGQRSAAPLIDVL